MYWVATYKDGSTLNSQKGCKYQDIDRSLLSHFSLVGDRNTIYTLWLDPGQRLIYRRRVFTTGDTEQVWHLMGWQQTITVAARGPSGGPVILAQENVQSIAYISDDGLRVNLAGKFREDHPLFYGVVIHPEEL